jgi:hypothetical protein
MKKLNKQKIKWVVKEMDKREVGAWTIAHTQKITARHARRVYRKCKNRKDPIIHKPGRKPKQITKEERRLVIETKKGRKFTEFLGKIFEPGSKSFDQIEIERKRKEYEDREGD